MGLRTRVRANPVRKTLVAALGEFIGTFMFLFFAFVGAQATILNTRAVDTDKAPDIATLVPLRFLLIVLAFGVGLTVNVWIFYRVSGGMFNPAVSLALRQRCSAVMLTGYPRSRSVLSSSAPFLPAGLLPSSRPSCWPGSQRVALQLCCCPGPCLSRTSLVPKPASYRAYC